METLFYTGTGDDGQVRVGDSVLSKSDPLFQILGELDAVNSLLGWSRSGIREGQYDSLRVILINLQEILFIGQAQFASLGFGFEVTHEVTDEHLQYLEKVIGVIDSEVPKLQHFVLPGGSELASRLEIARVRSRTLERRTVDFFEEEAMEGVDALLAVLNRFSSVLFALSRYVNHREEVSEEKPQYKVR